MTKLDYAIHIATGLGLAFVLIEIYLIGERKNRQHCNFTSETEWFV